jgi:hypothetical protein
MAKKEKRMPAFQMTLPQGASFSDNELTLLKRAGERQGWVEIVVLRKSDREFDLKIDGKYMVEMDERGPFKRIDDGTRPGYEQHQMGALTGRKVAKTFNFGAWLPLSVLNVAYHDRKLSRYVDDQGTGDWSFVRDADNECIWEMFNNVRGKL